MASEENAGGEQNPSGRSVESFGVSASKGEAVEEPAPSAASLSRQAVPNHDVNCGFLGVYPAFLQSYRTPRCYLFFICVLGMTQGFVVNGLVSVVTPTLERRFQLLGFEVGLIQSMFNVASCVMVTPVSYHGGVAHKPVILGVGALVMSAGSMVFASPHFLAPQYLVGDNGTASVCPDRGDAKCAASKGKSANTFKYFFMAGHALHGVGSSPFFTLGVAYMDQNVPASCASLYMGIFYATSVLGPAMGFLIGGYFLSVYTDLTVNTAELGMDSSSAHWIGAWWVGFFGASVIAFCVAFPVTSFPRALPTAAEKAKELALPKKSEDGAPKGDELAPLNPDEQPDAVDGKAAALPGEAAKEEPRSLVNHVKRLVTNPTFVFLTLAAAAESAISVPSACGGTLLGGYLVNKLKVKSSTIVRYCCILSFVPWFALFVFLYSCEGRQSALVNFTFTDDVHVLTFRDLERTCNAQCNCSTTVFDPVCGTDNFTYYSPCIAGCTDYKRLPKTTLYAPCTCVAGPSLPFRGNESGFEYMAKRDPCASECDLIPLYSIAMFVALFFTFLLIVPALTALLRCLDEDIKSTGIGLNYVAIRLLG